MPGAQSPARQRLDSPTSNIAVITTYGRHFATANTEFQWSGRHGRRSRTWLRTPEGWRVVGAHVLLLSV